MLQEITIKDLKNVHHSVGKQNMLIVYNELREHQKELGLDRFYFDDNFYWDGRNVKVNSKILDAMECGSSIYGCSFALPNNWYKDHTNKWYIFIEFLRKKYKGNSWANNIHTTENYIRTLLNKLRPCEELSKELLEKAEKEKEERLKKLENRVVVEDKAEKEADALAEYNYNRVKKNSNGYVYGIKVDGELVYIGKTIRPLKERIKEHIECMLDRTINNNQQKYLYEAMRLCEIGYKFEVLYESQNKISNHELEMIEKVLIENIKPKYNYEGVKVPYRFTEDKKRK